MLHSVMISAILILQFFSVEMADAAQEEGLEVVVEGVRATQGEVGIAVFNNKKGFPVQIEHAYATEWIPLKEDQKSVTALFDALPPGEYAISVMHDENGNRKLETSMVGFPKEGVGFSNDQKVVMSAPKFKKCKFALKPGELKKIVIQMDYRHAKKMEKVKSDKKKE